MVLAVQEVPVPFAVCTDSTVELRLRRKEADAQVAAARFRLETLALVASRLCKHLNLVDSEVQNRESACEGWRRRSRATPSGQGPIYELASAVLNCWFTNLLFSATTDAGLIFLILASCGEMDLTSGLPLRAAHPGL